MYVIIKSIKNKKSGKWLPVIILNSDNEVWEFESEKEADKMKEIFQTNSDSGHIYSVKKI
jgi:hypothetical protein